MASQTSKNQVYSVAGTPDTLDAMLKFVMDNAGIYFPSADVMYCDPYAMMTKDLTSAFVVGPATVDGMSREHLAFMALSPSTSSYSISGWQRKNVR
jgi:hypothetical protein